MKTSGHWADSYTKKHIRYMEDRHTKKKPTFVTKWPRPNWLAKQYNGLLLFTLQLLRNLTEK